MAGQHAQHPHSPEAGQPGQAVHISSAVVHCRPDRVERVARAIAASPGAEIYHRSDTKLVVILEGPDARTNGARLAEIALIEGVTAASLVYEQFDTAPMPGDAS